MLAPRFDNVAKKMYVGTGTTTTSTASQNWNTWLLKHLSLGTLMLRNLLPSQLMQVLMDSEQFYEQPIVYSSRALTRSQQNYAQIEKEALAILFGCEQFHQYIFGSVTVESDHKSLQSITKKPLH